MTTPNRGLINQVENTLQPGVAFNWQADIFDRRFGSLTIDFAADATLALTQIQTDYSVLVLTDSGPVLTGPQDVEFPEAFASMLVVNDTAQVLTMLKPGETGVEVPAGASMRVSCGPTDVVRETGLSGAVSSVNGMTGAVTGVTAGRHEVPITAAAISPSSTGGCAQLSIIASAANQPDIVTLNFDPSTQEYAQFSIPMPKSWNKGTITALFKWSHEATTTNFGVVWNIQAVAVSNDDTIAVNFGTAQQVADTGGTTNDLYVTSETPAITVAGSPANGDTVFFRISRVTGDGSDNMAIDARLHSVVLFITTDADTDA